MSAGRVVVYGGRGALGATCVERLKAADYWVCSVDLHPNESADVSVQVTGDSLQDQENNVLDAVRAALPENGKLDAVVNVAGGWAGGAADSADFSKNCDLCWRQSVWTSVVSTSMAARLMKPGGLLVLPGARPALSGTPGMQGYGLAKAAVHQLTQSLGENKSGLPEGACALAILPVTLDTPMNRKWMAKADKSGWTPMEAVADQVISWLPSESATRPKSGALMEIITKEGITEFNSV